MARILHASRPRTHPLGRHFWAGLQRRIALRRQRLDLARLNAHLLRDIGVAPDDAAREAARPFWSSLPD